MIWAGVVCLLCATPQSPDNLQELRVNWGIKKRLEEQMVFSCFPRISDNPDFQMIRVWASEQGCGGGSPPSPASFRTKQNRILRAQNVWETVPKY